MVLLECRLVGLGERIGQFSLRIGLSLLEAFAGEGQATKEPHQAFSRNSLLLSLLVLNQ